jgi:hypothetical protein
LKTTGSSFQRNFTSTNQPKIREIAMLEFGTADAITLARVEVSGFTKGSIFTARRKVIVAPKGAQGDS